MKIYSIVSAVLFASLSLASANSDMRMVMVSGDKNYGRYSIEKDVEVIRKSRSEISVQAFEGGHQVAPPSVMTKGFRWLLGEIQR